MADKKLHGTEQLGEKHWRSKLTETDVLQILEEGQVYGSQKRLAEKFGVSVPTIGAIIQRKAWAHLEIPYSNRHKETWSRGESAKNSKLTEAQVVEIRAAPRTHGMQTILAKRYGVHQVTISDILKRKSWTHLP